MQFSCIWVIDRTLSGATTLGLSGPGSNGNEEVLCIPQNSSITGTSQSDCLVSYLEHLLEESYHSAEMQLVYSTAPADWTIPPKKGYPHYDTKLYLRVRLQFWRCEKCWVPLHCYYSCSLWPGVVVLVSVPPMGQKDLFKKWFIFNRTMCKKTTKKNPKKKTNNKTTKKTKQKTKKQTQETTTQKIWTYTYP